MQLYCVCPYSLFLPDDDDDDVPLDDVDDDDVLYMKFCPDPANFQCFRGETVPLLGQEDCSRTGGDGDEGGESKFKQ